MVVDAGMVVTGYDRAAKFVNFPVPGFFPIFIAITKEKY